MGVALVFARIGGVVMYMPALGEAFVPVSKWLHGYRDIVMEMVAKGE